MRAVLGFRAHSGWAVAIAVAGTRRAPEVLRRTRIEMVNGTSPGGKQPYHRAAEMPFSGAEKLVNSAIQSANELAGQRLRDLIAELGNENTRIIAGRVLSASGRPLGDLESVLASHATIHAAEGELYRKALVQACANCAIPCAQIREKEIAEVATKQL